MSDEQDIAPPVRTSSAAVLQACFRALAKPGLGNNVMSERWREALGLPPEVPIYWSLDQALKLVERLGRDLRELPEGFEETRQHGDDIVANFRSALQPNMLVQGWAQVAPLVTEERLARLSMLSELLKLHRPEGRPAEGIIPGLLGRIGRVREELEGAPFPALARQAIEERISALEWAVANWHLIGAHGVSDLMGQMGAHIRLATRMVPSGDAGAVEKARRVSDAAVSAMDWIGRCMVVRDAGMGLSVLGHQFSQLLLPGTGTGG